MWLWEVWHSCGQNFLPSLPSPSRPPQTPQRDKAAFPGSSPGLWPNWPHLTPPPGEPGITREVQSLVGVWARMGKGHCSSRGAPWDQGGGS